MIKIKYYFGFVVCPMLFGAFAYLLSPRFEIVTQFAPETWQMWWQEQQLITTFDSFWSGQLADFCWSFSIASAIVLLWLENFKNWYTCIFCGTLTASSFEIAQAFGLAPGTYTNVDLIISIVAGFLASYSLFYLFIGGKNEKLG